MFFVKNYYFYQQIINTMNFDIDPIIPGVAVLVPRALPLATELLPLTGLL